MTKALTWTVKILALALIILGLPFYLGYGNPLPFIDSQYSAFDNLWLSIFPLMFIGLGLGWKWPKWAGIFLVSLLSLGLLVSYLLVGNLPLIMLAPLCVGGLYWVVSYSRQE